MKLSLYLAILLVFAAISCVIGDFANVHVLECDVAIGDADDWILIEGKNCAGV